MSGLRLAFLGFGTVGRALYTLLEARRDALASTYGLQYRVTGIASRRAGWRAEARGLDPFGSDGQNCRDIHDWLARSDADVVFEAIPLEPFTGEPALGYLAAALDHGAHAISANKGPVVHGYRQLSTLAAERGRVYRFESSVMDGAPLFSLVRECLPLADLHTISGVFTSTATVVLESIERGSSLADGIAEAQMRGIAEADPGYDVDGWDSAVKLCAIANVVFGGDLRPTAVERVGIRELAEADIREAHAQGNPIRLVGVVKRGVDGGLSAHVAPRRCSAGDPLGIVRGATLVTHYESEIFPGGLTVTSRDPDPTTTAYGMFADFVSAVQPQARIRR